MQFLKNDDNFRTFFPALLILLLLAIIARSPDGFAAPDTTGELDPNGPFPIIELQPYASGLTRPMDIANTGDPGDGRLFIVEKNGAIRIISSGGQVLAQPFLEIGGVASGSEQGLLGLAFDPNYESNGYFYINYTRSGGDTVISRFSVSGNPNLADETSETILLTIDQPYPNHNAGDLLFGPDGYLYIPLGDGGSGGDPADRAQNMALLLGKILRIDVSEDSVDNPSVDCGIGGRYTIPASNPFIGVANHCDEIWASGLRNPWRASFDRVTGDFYTGDVGQDSWEELNFQPASSPGGENYGWDCYEGFHLTSFNQTGCLAPDAYTPPIIEYPHPAGPPSITGGVVYRGSVYPGLEGIYFFADYGLGNLWSLLGDGEHWQYWQQPFAPPLNYSTFGEDSNGELYVADDSEGVIYRIVEYSLPHQTYLPIQRKDN